MSLFPSFCYIPSARLLRGGLPEPRAAVACFVKGCFVKSQRPRPPWACQTPAQVALLWQVPPIPGACRSGRCGVPWASAFSPLSPSRHMARDPSNLTPGPDAALPGERGLPHSCLGPAPHAGWLLCCGVHTSADSAWSPQPPPASDTAALRPASTFR